MKLFKINNNVSKFIVINSDMILAYFDYNIVTVKEKFTDIKWYNYKRE
jgi:hypothetical protein